MTGVGMKIKHMRELKNYTQEHMARELGMSITGYGKIERDETEITLSKLEMIAKILNTNFRKILDFDERKIYNIEHADNAAIGNDQVYYNSKMIEHLEGEVLYLRGEVAKLLNNIIEGKTEEREKRNVILVRKGLKKGLSIMEMSDLFDLTIDEVKSIKSKIENED